MARKKSAATKGIQLKDASLIELINEIMSRDEEIVISCGDAGNGRGVVRVSGSYEKAYYLAHVAGRIIMDNIMGRVHEAS